MTHSSNLMRFSVVFCLSLSVIFVTQCVGSCDAGHSTDTDGSENVGICTCTSASDSSTLTCSEEPTDCEVDEVLHRRSCYRFLRGNSDLKSRDDAHRDCIARNSHLVYIESVEEQTFLANHCHRQSPRDSSISAADHYWIGLIPTTNNTWLNRSLAHNDLFEFSQDSKAGCFSLYKSRGEVRLIGENCNRKNQFICERPYECRAGYYVNHEGSCYWFGRQKIFILARDSCRYWGGHLLYIESESELQFIDSHFDSENSARYWIGLITQYVWLDGSRAVYQDFGQREHSNNDDSLCFKLSPIDNFLWYDWDCSSNYSYICEREKTTLSREKQGSSEPCRPSLPNLNRLFDSLPICISSGRDHFDNAVLCQCNDKTTCISGCGCVRDITANGNETAQCSCGSCSFAFDTSENGNGLRWPSNFACICAANGTSSRATVVDGIFTCLTDNLESTTARRIEKRKTSGMTSTPSRVYQVSTENIATGRGGDSDGQVGISVGIPVAVSLVILFFLVALVAGFICWRRRGKRAKKGPTKQLTSDTRVVGSHTINVNPTYTGVCDDHVTEDILKPIAVARQKRVLKPQADTVYSNIKPIDQAASESECYVTIHSNGYTLDKPKDERDVHTTLHGKDSSEAKNTPDPATGYTAYKPQRGNDVYTDLKKTQNEADSDDDPAVYTLIPNNSSKPDKDGSDNEYVQPEDKAPPAGQRIGAGVSKATNPQLKLKNLTKDSEYVDVDAPATAVGDSDQKGRSDYVDVDAPAVVFSDVSTPAIQSKQPIGISGYVSVDGPSTKLPESQDHNYYQLENPSDNDEGEYSLAPTDNAYDTLNHAGAQRPSLNVPTEDGIYNPTDDAENNEYNTFNRAGNRRPSKNVESDDGVYSVTNPPDNNEYNTFDRAGDRRPSNNVPTDDSVYSVTNPPRANEYSAFNRTNNRGLRHNIPINEGVYSLTDPPQGDVYSTVNRGGRKEVSGVPAITTEDEYSTLT